MRMMSIPESFEWSNRKTEKLNDRTNLEKKLFLKKEELNIRYYLGVSLSDRAFRTRFFVPIVTKRAQTITTIPNAKLKLSS